MLCVLFNPAHKTLIIKHSSKIVMFVMLLLESPLFPKIRDEENH